MQNESINGHSLNITNKILCDYMAALPEVRLDYPFGPEVEVFKIKSKMFALLSMGKERVGNGDLSNKDVGQINLKCDPTEALMLRDIFPAVIPGYHMNKKHWNTVLLNGTLPERELYRMIDNSYLLVVEGLPAIERKGLKLRNASAPVFLTSTLG